jgi:hypothetical protein
VRGKVGPARDSVLWACILRELETSLPHDRSRVPILCPLSFLSPFLCLFFAVFQLLLLLLIVLAGPRSRGLQLSRLVYMGGAFRLSFALCFSQNPSGLEHCTPTNESVSAAWSHDSFECGSLGPAVEP